MNVHEVEDFSRLFPLIKNVYEEISILSKNNPVQAISSFKLKFVNILLARANEIFEEEYKPFPEFSSFSEDPAPNMSDVVFILAIYIASMKRMKEENVEKEGEYPHEWFWVINGKISDKVTSSPV